MLRLTLAVLSLVPSARAGADWSFSWAHPLPQGNALHSLAFETADRGYAVGLHGAVLRTDDGGTTWAVVQSHETLDAHLYDLVLPAPDTIIAVGQGVHRSLDGGLTFATLPTPSAGPFHDVHLLPGGALSAAGENGEVIVSTNGGDSWTSVGPGGTGLIRRHVWTDVDHGFVVGLEMAHATDDGGDTWTEFVTPPFFGFNDIFQTPGGELHAMDDFGWAYSLDGGDTWTYDNVFTEPLYRFRTVALTDDHWYLVAFGEGAELHETLDGGDTWTMHEFRSLLGNIGLAVTPGGRVVWTTDAGEIRYSDDGGATILPATVNLAEAVPFPSIAAFYDRGDGTVFAANFPTSSGTDTAIWLQSDDDGASWFVPPASPDLWWAFEGVFATPLSGAVADDEDIRYTTDGGGSWNVATLPAGQRVSDMAASGTDLFASTWTVAGGGRLYTSTDGGASWTQTGSGLPASWNVKTIDFVSPSVAYAFTSVPGGGSRLYRSNDGGTTFSLVRTGLEPVFSAAWFSEGIGIFGAAPSGTDGVYRTTDGGVTWDQVFDGPTRNVTIGGSGAAVAWGATSGHPFVGSSNFGETWSDVSVPIGEPYQLQGATVSAALFVGPDVLVGSSRARIVRGEALDPIAVPETGGPSALSGAPNPFRTRTRVTFDLPRSARATAAVFDVRGRHIADLAVGRPTAGPVTVAWDGRAAGGRVAPAGVYLIRLTTDTDVAGRRVVLVR